MSDMLQLVVMCNRFNFLQTNGPADIAPPLRILKEVESIAHHDKLKHIGHLVAAFP
jgi:hypothetical protein